MALPIGALALASDEVLLTSTTREVQGVSEIVEAWKPIAPAPGPVTARLATAFSALVARDLDP